MPDAAAEPTLGLTTMLLVCHDQLRHFAELALAVSTRRDLDAPQIRDATRRLVRYFRVTLPVHEADEEQTLSPALTAIATSEQRAAIDRMHDQHALLHDVLGDLFPHWVELARDVKGDASVTAPFARRLVAVLDVHLGLEESTIFPMITSLSDAERRRLFGDMRRRRVS